jgi:ketosteroid isomerase-like protein
VDEYVATGDWVIAVGRWVGRGKASGVPVEARGANAARWRDGKIVEYLLGFESKEAALKAVGLSEQAMSEENVETLRALYDAGNRGDWNAALRGVHTDFEWKTAASFPLAGTYRGREAVMTFLKGLREPFEEAVTEPEECSLNAAIKSWHSS